MVKPAILITLPAFIFYINCMTTRPQLPKVNRQKSIQERTMQYEENRIVDDSSFFLKPYIVGQTRYNYDELEPLFEADYTGAESRRLFNSAENYSLLSMICGATGGGFIGFNLGRSLAGGQAIPGLYYAGAGTIVLGVFFEAMVSSKMAEAITFYNRDLKKQLLPELNNIGEVEKVQNLQYSFRY